MKLEGTVIRLFKKLCVVYSQGKKYRVNIPRKIHLQGQDKFQSVAVGDHVEFLVRSSKEIILEKVFPRQSKLTRNNVGKMGKEQVVVANVDQLIVVGSISTPPFRPGILDRLVIAAHTGGMEPVIVINKMDLKEEEANWANIEKQLEIYRNISYQVVCTSVETGEGIDELRDILANKSSVLSGHSGVGKSALLSKVDEKIQLKSGAVGRKTGKGQHTTSSSQLLPLTAGGFVVDTPGIRGFSIWEIDPNSLDQYFLDLREYLHNCKYKSCSHTHEPSCAVKEAVAEGKISDFRYKSYCRILESIEEDIKEQQHW